jgi:haloalkane dehalogenase
MLIDFVPDKSLYPFESRWFDSSAGRVHYLDEGSGGSGSTILFCHGNPTWSFLYRTIIRDLRDRFRCVAVDYLGFGLSERPEGGRFGYTIEEHVGVVGELVDHLGLDGFILMGQDWGGPIGTGVAVDRADRVSGIVLGNTWFWPSDALIMKMFSRIMGSGPLQRRIIGKNLFVERFLPTGMTHKMSELEFDHYRRVQPTPSARAGVAVMPKQILAARPLLERLGRDVPDRLGGKPALLVWGMKDPAFRPKAGLPRMRSTFSDHVVVELPRAKHYIQEDAPGEIAEAITKRFA